MKKVFLLGQNIENSLSPFIHNYWIKKYGLQAEYHAISMNIAEAPVFLRNFAKEGFIGGNVTMPFKTMAFYLSDQNNTELGAINTLWFENKKIFGANSDIMGFEGLMARHGFGQARPGEKALILGNGGASKAVAFVLAHKGYEVYIASRYANSPSVIEYAQIKQHKFRLLVNSTPCTMQGYDSSEFLKQLDLKQIYENAQGKLGVIDIVYRPAETKLLQLAQQFGIKEIAGGLAMLLEQAGYGFYKWFGVKPKINDDLLHMLQNML